MRNIFARRLEDEIPDAGEPAGWDRLPGGVKAALAATVVGGGVAFLMFSGGSKPPQQVTAKRPDPAPNERINDYSAPPPAQGAIETVVNQVGAGLNTLGLTSTSTRRRRPPTEMALYSATAPGQAGATDQRRVNTLEPGAGDPDAVGPRGGADGEDRLAAHLAQPTALPTMRATLARNRDFMIDAGSDIPCLPVDAQNSALPGFTKCRVPEWYRSSNQRRGLLPPGTLITGQIRNGIAQGQERLGALYTRIDAGRFKVSIAAPGADAMGRAGLEADRQTFFWDRAGAVALYALFDVAIGAGQAAATAALSGAVAGGRGGTVLNLGGVGGQAQGLASQEMQSRLNRPPVLTRDQALPITVTVGQDLDFTAVCKQAMQVDPMACPLM